MDWFVQWWPIIVTVLLPFIVAAIAKVEWSGSAKAWLATGLSLAVGIGAAITSGIKVTPETVVVFVLAVRGGMEIAYNLFKKAGITSAWLDALLGVGSDTGTGYIEPAMQNYAPTPTYIEPPTVTYTTPDE